MLNPPPDLARCFSHHGSEAPHHPAALIVTLSFQPFLFLFLCQSNFPASPGLQFRAPHWHGVEGKKKKKKARKRREKTGGMRVALLPPGNNVGFVVTVMKDPSTLRLPFHFILIQHVTTRQNKVILIRKRQTYLSTVLE